MIKKKTRQSKYKNKITKIGDKTFHSAMESRYYRYLNKMIANGVVDSFQCQVPYVVADAFEKDDVGKFKAIRYIADFVVQYVDGHEEIIDVKGAVTDVFKIKRHLFEQRYPGKTIRLIKQNADKRWVDAKIT